MKTITPAELGQLMQRNDSIDLVDVRAPAEFRSVHVRCARSIPLDRISAEAVREGRGPNASGPTYVLCKSGQRAKQGAERLAAAGGGLDPVVIEGGTDACIAAGLEVVSGEGSMSLERQVRIAAGGLVAVGTVLAAAVDPWFWVIPGFVGCGLVFAGVTDTCAMGMMLARLPWNR